MSLCYSLAAVGSMVVVEGGGRGRSLPTDKHTDK